MLTLANISTLPFAARLLFVDCKRDNDRPTSTGRTFCSTADDDLDNRKLREVASFARDVCAIVERSQSIRIRDSSRKCRTFRSVHMRLIQMVGIVGRLSNRSWKVLFWEKNERFSLSLSLSWASVGGHHRTDDTPLPSWTSLSMPRPWCVRSLTVAWKSSSTVSIVLDDFPRPRPVSSIQVKPFPCRTDVLTR